MVIIQQWTTEHHKIQWLEPGNGGGSQSTFSISTNCAISCSDSIRSGLVLWCGKYFVTTLQKFKYLGVGTPFPEIFHLPNICLSANPEKNHTAQGTFFNLFENCKFRNFQFPKSTEISGTAKSSQISNFAKSLPIENFQFAKPEKKVVKETSPPTKDINCTEYFEA